jgi:hypothetical protein
MSRKIRGAVVLDFEANSRGGASIDRSDIHSGYYDSREASADDSLGPANSQIAGMTDKNILLHGNVIRIHLCNLELRMVGQTLAQELPGQYLL